MAFVKLDRLQFVQRLEEIRAGLASSQVFDQSGCYLFEQGRVFTSNGEVYGRTLSGLDGRYHAAVPAKPLLDLLRKAPGRTLEIDTSSASQIQFKLENGEEAGIVQTQELTLHYEQLEKVTSWHNLPKLFIEALSMVAACSAKRAIEEMAFMTCINVTPQFIEAFDNIQTCRYTFPTGVKQRYCLRAANVKTLEEMGALWFSESNGWIHFRNQNNSVVGCRKFSFEYPDLSPLMAMKGSKIAFPKILLETTERSQIFAGDDTENNHIKIHVQPLNNRLGKGELTIESQGLHGWHKSPPKVIPFSGEPLSFLISPKMFTSVIEKFDSFEVAERALLVLGDSWKYATVIKQD